MKFSKILTLIVGLSFLVITSGGEGGNGFNATSSVENRKSQVVNIDFEEGIEKFGDSTPEYIPGEVLVKFRTNILANSTVDIINITVKAGIAATVKRSFPFINAHQMKIADLNLTVEEAIKRLKSDPNVEYAEPNYIRRLFGTPNDPNFNQMWGLNNTGQTVNGTAGTFDADMDLPEAWDITTGSSNVIIAVIDSGVDYNHPDLLSNIWTNTGETNCSDGTDNDGNGRIDDCKGWDFVDSDNDPMDYNRHGTHVAGIIAAAGNNNLGIVGVNWTAKIMPLRCFNTLGEGSVGEIIAAIQYATQKGAHIINASYGSNSYSQTEKDAIDAFGAAGGLFVAAAGNGGTDGIGDNNDYTPFYPASYSSSNIIAVAASDQNDNLANFSNYGATSVDVAAPGKNIYSTIPERETIWSENFDSCNGNLSSCPNGAWTTGGTKNTWAVTTESSKSASYSLTDSPGANYAANTNSWSRSPVINLAGRRGCKLTYYLELYSESGYDGILVEASSDGTNFTTLNSYSGSTGGAFYEFEEDLTNYDSLAAVYARFRFLSNGTNNYNGAHIDDISVTCASSTYTGTEYEFLDGTSTAAPHVTGLAGLIKAQNSGITNTQIKDAILNSVDKKASLSGKVLTGGRVNALNALSNNPPSTSKLVYPADGQTGLGTAVEFRWKKSSDPDGDTVIYYLYYSIDPNFIGVTPIQVASLDKTGIYYADVWSGLLLLGIVFGYGVRVRRKVALLFIAMIMITIASCGGGGGSGGGNSNSGTSTPNPSDEITKVVSGLSAGTTYYWKVAADDGKGGVATSDTFSFKTQ